MSSNLWFQPGVGPDVAIRDGRVHLVYGHQPGVWLQFSFDGAMVSKGIRPIAYYPKTNGAVTLAHDGTRFVAWTPDAPDVVPPGIPVGVHATGISPNGQQFFYRQGDGVFTQTGAYRGVVALPNPYSSYGLWECRDDGTVRTWDECYYGPKPAGVVGQVQTSADGLVVVGEGAGGVVGTVRGVPFVLWPGEDTKWPRCASDGVHVAICCWGDPGPRVRLWIGTLDELAALVPPPLALPTVPAELAGRELWCGYFFALSDRPGYGDNLTAPGNCTVVLTEPEAARSPWRYFAPPGIGEGPKKIASWVNVARGEAWPVVPPSVVALYDGGSVLPTSPCPIGVTGLECYCDPAESLAACEARMRQWLTRWPDAPVWLVGQAYTRNGQETNRQKLLDLQALPLRLAVDYPQITAIIWFSDGRPTGTRENESWRPIHAEAAALVRRPDHMSEHRDTVQAERAKYPAPLYSAEGTLLNPMGNDNAARISRAVAWAHRAEGWGLLEKPTGNNVLGYSVDVIINAREKQVVDILGSSEAECYPQWSVIEWRDDYAARWRPPLAPDDAPPVEPPVDPPPSDDTEARLDAIEADIILLQAVAREVRRALEAVV